MNRSDKSGQSDILDRSGERKDWLTASWLGGGTIDRGEYFQLGCIPINNRDRFPPVKEKETGFEWMVERLVFKLGECCFQPDQMGRKKKMKDKENRLVTEHIICESKLLRWRMNRDGKKGIQQTNLCLEAVDCFFNTSVRIITQTVLHNRLVIFSCQRWPTNFAIPA